MADVYILSAVRTPIGKFGGSLASLTAADMGVVAAKAAMERAVAGLAPDERCAAAALLKKLGRHAQAELDQAPPA